VYLYTVGRTTFTGVNGVAGTDYADRLIGSEGGGIVGTVRAESFDPRGGNDTIIGGEGSDLATYVGARTDYTAVFAEGILTLTLTDTVSLPDGLDSVSEIEEFGFAGAIHLLQVVDGTGQSAPESAPT